VQQLVEAGVLKAPMDKPAAFPGYDAVAAQALSGRAEISDRVTEGEPRQTPIEKIKVVYSDRNEDPSQPKPQPDFRINKDGSVEVLSNPDTNNKKELVIEVERDAGQVSKPTDAQQQSIDGLVGYLSGRLMQQKPDGTKDGAIEDKQGLVSGQVENQARTAPPPEANLPEPARRQVENMDRFSGGGRGTLSPQQADSYFPTRDVPRQEGETNRQAALKDVVAGMATAGEKQPYQAMRNLGGDRGYGVGRYMLTFSDLMDWINDILGDPPDPKKLAELEKKNPKLAKHLQSKEFKQLMDKLKSGQQPTVDELNKGLPKDFQENAATHLTDKYGELTKDAQGQIDPAKVALAMALGHAPTEAEMAKPENQSFYKAAERLSSISTARTENPGQNLDWSDTNQRLLVSAKNSVGKALWAQSDFNAATLEYGNLGCAASISEVFKNAGFKGINSASVSGLESQMKKQGAQQVNPSEVAPGDVVIFMKGGSSAGRHIGIMGTDGKVVNNSSSKKVMVDKPLSDYNGYFSGIRVWRMPDNNARNA
jgi:hypothetical protein